ncbi:MAG TPA: PAC2 family protein [Actinomycetota bacterium]|nr:PAC2 family protein [Actinomycetota bacterium]
MASYEIVGSTQDAVAPVLIVAFEDWVDAGSAGSTAARHIAQGGDVAVDFDPDMLYDYRSHRPILDIVDGSPTSIAMPRMRMWRRAISERDFFVLTGPEPDYRWREFAAGVLRVARDIGIQEHVSLGAIPSAVPHTAPTPVMMTASSKDAVSGQPVVEGLLRVPAAAVSLIEWSNAQAGIATVGFWAQVPHYASPYTAGAIALVRRVETHLDVTIGAGDLETEAAAQAKTLSELIAANAEAQEYVERLQHLVGEQDVPTAENIAEEVERFLRNQRRGGGPTPFSP